MDESAVGGHVDGRVAVGCTVQLWGRQDRRQRVAGVATVAVCGVGWRRMWEGGVECARLTCVCPVNCCAHGDRAGAAGDNVVARRRDDGTGVRRARRSRSRRGSRLRRQRR